MKAHIQTQFPPKILFYAIKPGSEKERALAGLCREEGILWEEVPAGRLGDPLGLLAGLAGFSPSLAPWEKELPAREAMVFCGLEEKKVRQVELKAMMTPHNQRWPFGALLGELEKEHLALHRR